MDVKYQIFISSTFRDLQDARRVVMEQILNLQHIPVGMELFQASDKTQWEYIKERILECDYYIVILAERYGSVDVDGFSYTQKEYEFAIAHEIPVASFLLHEDARRIWPQEHVEFESREKVNAFRGLCAGRMSKFWRTTEELGMQVTQAIVEITRRQPRTGWIRADQGVTGAVANEIAHLLEQNRVLKSELDRVGTANPDGQILSIVSSLDNRFLRDYIIFHDGGFGDTKVAILAEGHGSTMSLSDGFALIGKKLSTGVTPYAAASLIIQPFHNKTSYDAEPFFAELATVDLIDVRYTQETMFERITSQPLYILSPLGKKVLQFIYQR